MRRLRVALVVLVGVLAVFAVSFSTRLWAAPGSDALRQTVPTITPTSPPRPPREGTPTVAEPTATPTGTALPVVPPTSTAQPSPTTAASPVASETAGSPSPTPVPMWDFGDAPEPGFPSLLASDGARHSAVGFEWLGDSVGREAESAQANRDTHDDGVELVPIAACSQVDLGVKVTVADRHDAEHPYDAQHLLYLNVLMDWNGDGSWGGSSTCPNGVTAWEWAVRNLAVDVSSWPEGLTSAPLAVQFSAGPRAGEVWARFTLSYGEVISGNDWDGRGAFTFGETEDYLLTVSGPSVAPPGSATATVEARPTATVAGAPSVDKSWWLLLLGFAVGLLIGVIGVAIWALGRRRGWPFLNWLLLAFVILLAGALACAAATVLFWSRISEGPSLPISPTPYERLIPTAGVGGETVQSGATTRQTGPTLPAEPHFLVATPAPSLLVVRDRFGFGAPILPLDQFAVEELHAGWYLDWRSETSPSRPQGMEFAQMIRVRGESYSPSGQELEDVIASNLGSLWLVGNEPDVIWQDNTEPADYARVYHEVYTLLKSRDPACQVAIGGVSQATPLRLQYLDMIVEAYQALYGEMIPVDVWNVHAFMLREERGSWGVDIPPGISADRGRLYEIADHDKIDLFREQILSFRRWMRDRGQRDKPLIVSEYGVLMPEEYGFSFERVRDFMYASFDYLLTARDVSLGCPADDNRLVQRWAWYSLSDSVYPTGNLFDPHTDQITPLGLAYGSYVSSH